MFSYSLIFILCRCYFFGDVSSKRDPTAYLKYITTLYDYYRKEYYMFNHSESPGCTELPLVVNTPGWVKGALLNVCNCIFVSLICNENFFSFLSL